MSELILDKDELLKKCRSGTKMKYVFFWGHENMAKSKMNKACLSQWAPSPFVVDGVTYKTAEHYMMAGKARLFGDNEILDRITQADHPNAAKALGRKVRNFDNETWLKNRFDIVVAGNIAKFSQQPEMRNFLIGTNNRILVEASPYDRIWGIGMSETDEGIMHPENWRGENLLGFALMKVREELCKGSTESP